MLSLKIDNQFIALPDSTEISIEASNPIFSDAGAKTYLFEIPVESLRYIIGNADEIYGESLYDTLEGKRAEIYIDGVQFFSGVVNLEDSISIEDGKIAVSIASGNLEFAQMIEGMNCRDVEQAEEVVVGKKYTRVDIKWRKKPGWYAHKAPQDDRHFDRSYELPNEFTITRDYYNVSEEYPGKKYCNIRCACTSPNGLKVERYIEGDYTEMVQHEIGFWDKPYYGLEASRRNSGVCFYVRYFLDCLEKTLGLIFETKIFDEIQDFNRLAFVNMGCRVVKEGNLESANIDEQDIYDGFISAIPGVQSISNSQMKKVYNAEATCFFHEAVATSENFPDIDVSEAVDALYSAFGVKALCNSDTNEVKFIFIKDVLLSSDIIELYPQIYSAKRIHNNISGFRLSYGSDSDTNYNIPDLDSYETKSDYSSILKEVTAFNDTLYIDSRNGNAYAIKVDEEADSSGDEKNLNPSLFEVGPFSMVEYGVCKNEGLIEKVEIPFTPIINFDAEGKTNKDKATADVGDGDLNNKYALLLELDIEPEPKKYEKEYNLVLFSRGSGDDYESVSFVPTLGICFYDYLGSNSDVSTMRNWRPAEDESKVNSYDTGFMLGIMRGPGSDSKPDAFGQDFDGEGNYRVAYTAANYAFTSDSIDNCNRDFDYNGTGEGVGDDGLEGRISLKLRAGKYDKDGNLIPALRDTNGNSILPKDRAERGLYDKFWKEYAYFTVNKRIVRITCEMEVADIVNIDWTKRYKIGDWIGFIANYSYNVNKNGISEVELEMYYI